MVYSRIQFLATNSVRVHLSIHVSNGHLPVPNVYKVSPVQHTFVASIQIHLRLGPYSTLASKFPDNLQHLRNDTQPSFGQIILD